MNKHEAELMEQIGQIIDRLQAVQRDIAGTRQPPSGLELETLKELGARYAQLYAELQDYYAARTVARAQNDATR